jgi:hypothetical protein
LFCLAAGEVLAGLIFEFAVDVLEKHFGREWFRKYLQTIFMRSINVGFRISAEENYAAFRKQRTELHGRGDSIDPRHLNVRNDERRVCSLRDENRGFAGVCGGSLISSLREDDCERVCNRVFIIDNKDTSTNGFIYGIQKVVYPVSQILSSMARVMRVVESVSAL